MILGVVGAVVVLVGGGLLLYFLVFSGDDDEASTDDYCNLLEDNAEKFAGLTSGNIDPETAEDAVSVVHEIREAAPDEVADEWASIDDPLQDFQQALDDAGITWQDIQEAEGPDDVPESVATAAQQLFSEFGQLDMSAINQTIDDHAKDECNIDLQEIEQGGSSDQ